MLKTLVLCAITLACISLYDAMPNYPNVRGKKDSMNEVKANGVFKFEMTDKNQYYISEDNGATWSWFIDGQWAAGYTTTSRQTTANGIQFVIKRTDTNIWVRVGPTQVWWDTNPNNIANFWGNGRWTSTGSDSQNAVYKFELTDKNEYYISTDNAATWNWYRNGRWAASYTLYSRRNINGGLEVIIKRTDRVWYIRVGPTQVFEGGDPNNVNSFWGRGHWTILGNSIEDGTDNNDNEVSSRTSGYPDLQTKDESSVETKGGVFKFELTDRDEYYISRDNGVTWRWYRSEVLAARYRLYSSRNTADGLEVIIKRIDREWYMRVGPKRVYEGSDPDNLNTLWGKGFWTILGNSIEDGTDNNDNNDDGHEKCD